MIPLTYFRKYLLFSLLLISARIAFSDPTNDERLKVTSYYEDTHRSLRGGSYSGRSSSSSSGSSGSWGGWSRNRNSNNSSNNSSNNNSNGNNNSYNRNNRRGMGTMGKVFTGLALAGVGLLVMSLLFPAVGAAACCPLLLAACCCGGVAAGAAAATATATAPSNNNDYKNAGSEMDNNYHHGQQSPSTSSRRDDDAFEARVQEARCDIENNASPGGTPQARPFSGQYTLSFVDPESRVTHNASISVFFTPDHRGLGFQMNGQGSDIDGSTTIEDGHANHDGMAWWRERNITGDVGLQVLSRGRFDFQRRTFQGTWLASTMLTGPYYSFSAVANNQSYPNLNGTAGAPVVIPGERVSSTQFHHTPNNYGGVFRTDGQTNNAPVVQGSVVQPSATTYPQSGGYVSPIVTVTGQPV